jgi:hypothetical protein
MTSCRCELDAHKHGLVSPLAYFTEKSFIDNEDIMAEALLLSRGVQQIVKSVTGSALSSISQSKVCLHSFQAARCSGVLPKSSGPLMTAALATFATR